MSGPEETKEVRAARLAEALRENLKKRKAQARSRREAGCEAAGRTNGAEGAGNSRDEKRDEADAPRD